MTGGTPPEPPDRATPAADDLAKTRYGDPYPPPSAAGAPPFGVAAHAAAVPEPNRNAVRALGVRGVRAAEPASPRSATDEPPPQRGSTRTTWQPERSTRRPPALPAKRPTAGAALQPSAAEHGVGPDGARPRAAADAAPQPSAAEPDAGPDRAEPRAAASAERAPTEAPAWPAAPRTSVFVPLEQLPIGQREPTRSAGSHDPVAMLDDSAQPGSSPTGPV